MNDNNNIQLKDIQIKTLKDNKVLSYQDYSFIKCKYRQKSYGFYKKNNSEWRPFLGLLVDKNQSFKLGILVHKIIDIKKNDITESISFKLGGGKWLIQKDRGSFLNLQNQEKENIYYHINKFIDSPFNKFIKQHREGFYYFCKDNQNYDDLPNHEVSFTPIKELDEFKIVSDINNAEKLKYKDFSLLPYLVTNNIKLLENIFVYRNELSFTLNFYKNTYNKNLILRYNLIFYYQNDDFKFKYLLYQEIKNLKNTYLGKIKKTIVKQVRDYNLIKRNVKEINLVEIDLIDILLNLNVDFVVEVVLLNPKLFTSSETKKYIKSKTTQTNHYISSHLLKLK